MTERDRAIGIGDAGERGRHMRLARHRGHRADHRGIDDVVRPELAVDHGGEHLRRRVFAKLRRHQPCSASLGSRLCGASLFAVMLYCNDTKANRPAAQRIASSEERRVCTECVSTGRSGWWPYPYKKTNK